MRWILVAFFASTVIGCPSSNGADGGTDAGVWGGITVPMVWAVQLEASENVSAMGAFDDGDLLIALATERPGSGTPSKSVIQRRARTDGAVIWEYEIGRLGLGPLWCQPCQHRIGFLDVAQDGQSAATVLGEFVLVLTLNGDGTQRWLQFSPPPASLVPHIDVDGLVWVPPFTIDDAGYHPVPFLVAPSWAPTDAFDVGQFIVVYGTSGLRSSIRALELTGQVKWERPVTYEERPHLDVPFELKFGVGHQMYARYDGFTVDGGEARADLGCDAGASHSITAISPTGECLWTREVASSDFAPSSAGIVVADFQRVVEFDARDGLVLNEFETGARSLASSPQTSIIYISSPNGREFGRLR